ncbi:hypothetical protein FHG87_017297 [Trinorchestia longiramus]|nr:hypothetical protein FHG87_017297 [Trinorchestia longiramus]
MGARHESGRSSQGQTASSGRLREKRRKHSRDFVSDFDFLGFMEEDSLLDFEGFTMDDRVECKRRKLAKEMGYYDEGTPGDGNVGVMDEDHGWPDDAGEGLDESKDGSSHDAPEALSLGGKSLDGDGKQLHKYEKVHVNVSTKLNPPRGLFEDSTEMVDELHMELYASDVDIDIKDDSINFDEEDSQNISQFSDLGIEQKAIDERIKFQDANDTAETGSVLAENQAQHLDCNALRRDNIESPERDVGEDAEDVDHELSVENFRDASLREQDNEDLKDDKVNDENEYKLDDDLEKEHNESMEVSDLRLSDLDESLELVKTEVASCTSSVTGGRSSDSCSQSVPKSSGEERYTHMATEQLISKKHIQSVNDAMPSNTAPNDLTRLSSTELHLPIHSGSSGERSAPSRSPTLKDDTVSPPLVSCRISCNSRILASGEHHSPQKKIETFLQKPQLLSTSDQVVKDAYKHRKNDVETPKFLGRSVPLSSCSLVSQPVLFSSPSFNSTQRTNVDSVTRSSFSCKSDPLLHHSASVAPNDLVPRLPETESAFPLKKAFHQEVVKCDASLAATREEYLNPASNIIVKDNCKEPVEVKKMDSISSPAHKYIIKVADSKLMSGASNLTQAQSQLPSNRAQVARSVASASGIHNKNAIVTKSSGIITFNRNLLFSSVNSNKNQIGGNVNKPHAEKPKDALQQQQFKLFSSSFPQPITKDDGSPVPTVSNKIITFKISDLIDRPKTP